MLLPLVWSLRPRLRAGRVRGPVLPPTLLDSAAGLANDWLEQGRQELAWASLRGELTVPWTISSYRRRI